MAITKMEMRQIAKKLKRVELEVLWMKERLLPIVKPTKREKRALMEARNEIAKGEWISGDELRKKLMS